MKDKSLLIAGIIFIVLALVVAAIIVFTQTPPIITKTATATIDVLAKPDFELALNYPEGWKSPIGRTVPLGVTVTSVNEFAGEIQISVEVPADWTYVFPLGDDTITLGPDSPRGLQIDITIPDDPAQIGTHTITVTAETLHYN